MTVASSGRLILIALLTACLSCNSRNAAIEPIAAPTGPTPAVPGLMVSFDPPGVMGGTTARGTVTLAQPAPAGGTLVTLQSGHPAVSVPSAVAVAPGALSAGFPVTTASVAADAAGSVSASAPGASATGSLAVWAVLPTFLSAVSEPGGFIGQGGFRRFTPQTATFTGSCSQSEVSIFVRDGFDFWILQFGAPRGAPLRPGLYEGATRTAFRNATSPGIDISGSGGCNQTRGRFTVHDVSMTRTGTVQRFWATFEQYCDQNPAALRGDIRVTALTAPNFTASCVVP
jgi:hypothetical protein